MLATRLREIEAAGVLSRLPLRHNTRAYALTDRGLALRDATVALARWGTEDAQGRVCALRCSPPLTGQEIGRASCCGAGFQYVSSDGDGAPVNTKTNHSY